MLLIIVNFPRMNGLRHIIYLSRYLSNTKGVPSSYGGAPCPIYGVFLDGVFDLVRVASGLVRLYLRLARIAWRLVRLYL